MTTPVVDYSDSPWAQSRRREKAAFLMDALFAAGLDAATAVHLTDQEWKDAAKAARVRPPSVKTRRLVVDLMAHAASERQVLCPTCGLGNPAGERGPALAAGHGGECRR